LLTIVRNDVGKAFCLGCFSEGNRKHEGAQTKTERIGEWKPAHQTNPPNRPADRLSGKKVSRLPLPVRQAGAHRRYNG
jgi:hypothetical protein